MAFPPGHSVRSVYHLKSCCSSKLRCCRLSSTAMDSPPVGVDHLDEIPKLVPDHAVDLRLSYGAIRGM